MRKNLQHITLKSKTINKKPIVDSILTSVEGFEVKSTYSKNDIKHLEHLNFAAGITPNLRGLNSTMYTRKPWTIRQYDRLSTAKDNNASYRQSLKAGQEELSIAFNLITHRGYDSDHKRVVGGVGTTEVAIDTVEDMKILFNQIPLDSISVSIIMNDAILPIIAFYIVAAEEQGIKQEQLAGTIQNDLLKEFMVRDTYIYPSIPSMKIVTDIIKYTSKNMPKFNSISISGYHIQEAGATCDIELAYTLLDGIEYIKKGLKVGMDIDIFAPRISFFWGISMNHFTEIAKMRAARILWAKLVKQFNPKNEKSLALRVHCQTSSSNLTKQDPFNNIARTTIQASAAVFGGTQSLHTNALDKAIALSTDSSARIARNTQLFLQEETYITKTVDPWAGSYYVEKLTHDIAQKAWKLIQEIEELGGMSKAIKAGIPKLRIEEAAAKKQARINSEEDIIVGVNDYALEQESPIQIHEVDNKSVREQQIKQLNNIKSTRNSEKVESTLINLTKAAKSGKENLLALTIKAARERATLEEINKALEVVYIKHQT